MIKNQSISNITIIVLICVGIVALIVAIIWTKVIKKNDWIYCNKSLITIQLIKKDLENFLEQQNFDYVLMTDIFFSSVETHKNCFFYLNNVVITHKNVYLITYEISRKGRRIQQEKNKYFLLDKKGKQFNFPVEVETVFENYRNIKKILNTEIKIIVPFSNDNFDKDFFPTNENIICLNTKNLKQFILETENATEKVVNENLELIRTTIAKNNYQKRIRLPFVNLKTKDTVWEKKK